MTLKVNTVIKLINKESYVILNEINYENEKYFLVMGVDDNKDVIPAKVLIIKEVLKNNKAFVKIVTDQELIVKLTKILKSQM